MKKILTMFLVLCVVVTMLPTRVVAKDVDLAIETTGEVIAFEELEPSQFM